MLPLLKTRFYQFVEHGREHGFLPACKTVLYKYEEAVPVEKDLTSLKPLQQLKGGDYRILEVTRSNFHQIELPYTFSSRRARVPRYFKRGYQSFVLIKDGRIIGDLWYVTRETANREPAHPHLGWFDMDLQKNEVYMFDMFVDPGERGSALTTFFMNSVLHVWKSRGFSRSYGYFVADYVPALWVHRLLGYKELPHHIVKRFFMVDVVRRKTA